MFTVRSLHSQLTYCKVDIHEDKFLIRIQEAIDEL